MLRQRILTALVLAPLVLLTILWLPHTAAAVVFALLVLAGAWEWSAFPGFTRHSARLGYVALVAACLALVWLAQRNGAIDGLLYSAALWWMLAIVWIVVLPTRIAPLSAAFAGLLVLLPAWLALTELHAVGRELLLFLLLLVVAADVGAYFAGRQFGKHKLAPRVSPGKTWEGVIGGLVAAAILALVGVWWFEMEAMTFVLLCAIVVIASIVGDLTESMFKRHAGLKDSGNLLPGHGGVLDRVDSVTAAAPIFLLGLERLGLLW
jgi:phosphatidate cytidylyltransferase